MAGYRSVRERKVRSSDRGRVGEEGGKKAVQNKIVIQSEGKQRAE